MTVEPGHEPFDRGRAPRTTPQYAPVQPGLSGQPAHYNAVRHGNHVEESPELLRWRADLLMDEMMMGGVDVSAADGNRTFSGVDAPVVSRPQVQPHSTQNGQNGHAHPDKPSGYETSGYENGSYGARGYENGGHVSDRYANGREHGAYDNGSAQFDDISPQGWPSRDRDDRGGHDHGGHVGHNGDFAHGSAYYDDPYPANGHMPDAPRHDYDHGYEDGVYPHERTRRDESPNESLRQGYPSPSARHPVAPETPHTRPASDAYEHGRVERGRADAGQYEPGYTAERPINNGYHEEPNVRGVSAPRHYPDAPPNAPARPNEPPRDSAQVDPARVDERPIADDYPSTLRTKVDNLPAYGRADASPAVGSQDQPPRTDRLYAVEQQYEQFRREQSNNVQPVDPPHPEHRHQESRPHEEPVRTATRPPLPPVEPTRYPTTPPRVTPPPVDEHTQWATGPDKWEYQDFGTDPQEAEDDLLFGGQPAPERRYAQESAVRHDPAQFVSAMSVMNNGKKRSTLLPRSTELDVDTLHREISDLHGEIAALLPVGNETSERARHLLDKAYSILQSDPSRSAEVEYYMQQVRTIVQRLRQSRQWSDLYRQRLHVYLLGWLGLSAMVLLARFFFQIDLEALIMWVTGVAAESWLVAHWATFVGTAGAGAFGGALGALYTMRGHARGEHSFFDRKYGLRGLILPLMGMIVGMVGYVIFGVLFALTGINPALSLTAAIIPTTAAFAFGFSQESIYGTRG